MASLDLTPRRIIELFGRVDAQLYQLTDRNHDVMIAGGAAVALLWDDQRITNDVDVVSEGMTPLLRTAVARVARDVDKRDIPALLAASDVKTRAELYQIVQDAYPSQMIPAATSYIIDQAWEAHKQNRVQHREREGPSRGLSISLQPHSKGPNISSRNPLAS